MGQLYRPDKIKGKLTYVNCVLYIGSSIDTLHRTSARWEVWRHDECFAHQRSMHILHPAVSSIDRLQGPVTFTIDSRKYEYVDQTPPTAKKTTGGVNTLAADTANPRDGISPPTQPLAQS